MKTKTVAHTPDHVFNPSSICSCEIQWSGKAATIIYCAAHSAALDLLKSYEREKARREQLEKELECYHSIINDRASTCVYCGDSEERVQRLEAEIAIVVEALEQTHLHLMAIIPEEPNALKHQTGKALNYLKEALAKLKEKP